MQTLAGPLILSWINEICAGDLEKRALLVAAGNDLAYVVQAVAPNFVWKTVNFPNAQAGFTWSIVLQILLSESLRAFLLITSYLDNTDSSLTPTRRTQGTSGCGCKHPNEIGRAWPS